MRTLALLFASTSALAGDFLNLNFDSPDLSGPLTTTYPGGPLEGATAQLMQGWSIQYRGESQSSIFFASLGLQWANSVTLTENSMEWLQSGLGRYSLIIEGFRPAPGTTPTPSSMDTRISQRGMIPTDAGGLRFFGGGYVQMFVNGERVGDSVSLDPVNVSRWAGQEVDLEFRVGAGDSARLDILGFTNVPEPSIWALLSLGATALGWQLHGGLRRKGGDSAKRDEPLP